MRVCPNFANLVTISSSYLDGGVEAGSSPGWGGRRCETRRPATRRWLEVEQRCNVPTSEFSSFPSTPYRTRHGTDTSPQLTALQNGTWPKICTLFSQCFDHGCSLFRFSVQLFKFQNAKNSLFLQVTCYCYVWHANWRLKLWSLLETVLVENISQNSLKISPKKNSPQK